MQTTGVFSPFWKALAPVLAIICVYNLFLEFLKSVGIVKSK